VSEKCGCNSFPVGPDMRSDGRMMYEITYCPLHAAAPEMLEVLIRVSKEMTCFDCRETAKLVDAIIVKADGKSTTIDSRKSHD
jgi:hypothetical protein